MSKIIISVTNDLMTDQRVHRIASSLAEYGAEITLVGRKLKRSKPLEPLSYQTVRFTLLFNKGFLFYAAYNFRLFIYLLFSKFDALVSNDLDTLPANYLISIIRRKTLVYDSHELYTEVPELIGRKRIQNIWRKIEKNILPKIKYCYTVSPSIARYYNELYHIKMVVIRNLPVRNRSHSLPDRKIELPKKKIIIYQGSVNLGRGLEKMIRAMNFIDDSLFVIVGDGDVKQQLELLVNNEKLTDKVLFTGRLAFSQIRQYTIQASLGVSLEENLGLNYYYSLPNKVFDYIQSGIPVLTSDFPEVSNIVHTYNIGATTQLSDPAALAEVIKDMLTNENKIKIWKTNLDKAAKELCWEIEEQNLLSIYRQAGILKNLL